MPEPAQKALKQQIGNTVSVRCQLGRSIELVMTRLRVCVHWLILASQAAWSRLVYRLMVEVDEHSVHNKSDHEPEGVLKNSFESRRHSPDDTRSRWSAKDGSSSRRLLGLSPPRPVSLFCVVRIRAIAARRPGPISHSAIRGAQEYHVGPWRRSPIDRFCAADVETPIGESPSRLLRLPSPSSKRKSDGCGSQERCMPSPMIYEAGVGKTRTGYTFPSGSSRSGESKWT
jgi:hypothetical protein